MAERPVCLGVLFTDGSSRKFGPCDPAVVAEAIGRFTRCGGGIALCLTDGLAVRVEDVRAVYATGDFTSDDSDDRGNE